MLLGHGALNDDEGKHGHYHLKKVSQWLNIWLNFDSHYVGTYGTFAPFCKTCMQNLSHEIVRKNAFQGWCNTRALETQQDGGYQVSDDEWTIADLRDVDNFHKSQYAAVLSQQFLEKSKTAKDLKKVEDDVQGVLATLKATTIAPGASSSSTGGLGGDHAHPPIGPTPRTCLPAEDTTDMMHIDEDEL